MVGYTCHSEDAGKDAHTICDKWNHSILRGWQGSSASSFNEPWRHAALTAAGCGPNKHQPSATLGGAQNVEPSKILAECDFKTPRAPPHGVPASPDHHHPNIAIPSPPSPRSGGGRLGPPPPRHGILATTHNARRPVEPLAATLRVDCAPAAHRKPAPAEATPSLCVCRPRAPGATRESAPPMGGRQTRCPKRGPRPDRTSPKKAGGQHPMDTARSTAIESNIAVPSRSGRPAWNRKILLRLTTSANGDLPTPNSDAVQPKSHYPVSNFGPRFPDHADPLAQMSRSPGGGWQMAQICGGAHRQVPKSRLHQKRMSCRRSSAPRLQIRWCGLSRQVFHVRRAQSPTSELRGCGGCEAPVIGNMHRKSERRSVQRSNVFMNRSCRSLCVGATLTRKKKKRRQRDREGEANTRGRKTPPHKNSEQKTPRRETKAATRHEYSLQVSSGHGRPEECV